MTGQSTLGIIYIISTKKYFQKMYKDVGKEVSKRRCRDSIITKLIIHSSIPTFFSHVTACSTLALIYTVYHVLYQAVLEMSSIPIVFIALVIIYVAVWSLMIVKQN